MQYLIDPHVCLWAIAEKKKLSPKVRSILEDTSLKIFVSQVSLFEIAIKLNIGKLPDFHVSLAEFTESLYSAGFELLPVKNEHIFTYSQFDYPLEHRDPFDRLLIATSFYEKTAFISKDSFQLYTDKVEIIWS